MVAMLSPSEAVARFEYNSETAPLHQISGVLSQMSLLFDRLKGPGLVDTTGTHLLYLLSALSFISKVAVTTVDENVIKQSTMIIIISFLSMLFSYYQFPYVLPSKPQLLR